tara:strand:- start:265 stop:867 length:603 start_codon:yes stop_codon:yes gene_type:complete
MQYGVITRARVAGDYRDQGIKAMKQWKEISLANGAQAVRLGMIQSGSNVGALVAFQFFESMGDIESVYDAFMEAPITKQTLESGKFDIFGRTIVKNLLQFGTSGGDPKYIVLTVGTADDPALETVTKFAGVLNANGCMSGRYGQFVVGDTATGKRFLFGASYPSLSAVQSAYDAVAEDGIAGDLYKLVSVSKRQIVRVIK